ncbi:MAG TPA: hypothetical protein VNE82_08795 [Candidatus Binataceae bacterium]|nr:hypothetical protein [Candidatus Binataceae bacterium]HVB80028.1 hypothetical protein [Candidatus Binataceae bacterium]
MAKAEKQEAATATEDMGSPDQVRIQARAEASLLSGMATEIYGNADKYSAEDRPHYLAAAQRLATVAGGLEAVANSRTDTGFTHAIFGMCQPDLRDAEPRVGSLELAVAGGLAAGKVQRSATPQERAAGVALLTSFGNTLVSIPGRCDQAQAVIAEAETQEQEAEVEHQANVNRALTAAAMIFVGTVMAAGEVGAAVVNQENANAQSSYLTGQQLNEENSAALQERASQLQMNPPAPIGLGSGFSQTVPQPVVTTVPAPGLPFP